MMQQTSQAHNRGKKYENNGKGGYFRFDVDINMSYRYIISITKTEMGQLNIYNPIYCNENQTYIVFYLCNVANRRNFPSEKVEKNNCCMLEVKCKVNEISLRFFLLMLLTERQRDRDRHTDIQTDKQTKTTNKDEFISLVVRLG